MRKITQEEKEAMQLKPPGRSTHLRNMLHNLKVGEAVLLERRDWTWKDKSPSWYVKRLEKTRGPHYTCMARVDGNGWVIERVK